ncbi:DMT family transporter [Algihabitans albus]|uniref:DMT family transporter n=1 Tax=Algihabitans albus TaxID=2164067 RepID=UPI0035D118DD
MADRLRVAPEAGRGDPAASHNPALPAIGAMLAAAALIAVTTLLAKILGRGLTGPELHPLQVSAGRFCFAMLALVPVLVWRYPGFRGAAWPLHIGRSLCGWGGVTCLFAAAALMPLAEATAISFLSPLVTMLLAIALLRERVGPWRWTAAGLAMLGALVLIQPGSDAFQVAALIALLAALLMGLEAIFIKRLSGREPPLRILAINNAIGATVAATAAAFVWIAPSPAQWALLALLGVTMVIGQSFFIQAMKRADASFVMPVFYATLVFAALYDLAVFGERPSVLAGVGAGLIVIGAVILAWREGRRARA